MSCSSQYSTTSVTGCGMYYHACKGSIAANSKRVANEVVAGFFSCYLRDP